MTDLPPYPRNYICIVPPIPTVTGIGTVGNPYVLSYPSMWSTLPAGSQSAAKGVDLAQLKAQGFVVGVSCALGWEISILGEAQKYYDAYFKPFVDADIPVIADTLWVIYDSPTMRYEDTRVTKSPVYVQHDAPPTPPTAYVSYQLAYNWNGYAAGTWFNGCPINVNTGSLTAYSNVVSLLYDPDGVTPRIPLESEFTTAFDDGLEFLINNNIKGVTLEGKHDVIAEYLSAFAHTHNIEFMQMWAYQESPYYSLEVWGGAPLYTPNTFVDGWVGPWSDPPRLPTLAELEAHWDYRIGLADENLIELYALYWCMPHSRVGYSNGTTRDVVTAHNYGTWMCAYIWANHPTIKFGILTIIHSPRITGVYSPWSNTSHLTCERDTAWYEDCDWDGATAMGIAGTGATQEYPFNAPHDWTNQRHANAVATLNYIRDTYGGKWDSSWTQNTTRYYPSMGWAADEVIISRFTDLAPKPTHTLSQTGCTPLYSSVSICDTLATIQPDTFANTGNELILLKDIGVASTHDITVTSSIDPLTHVDHTLALSPDRGTLIGPYPLDEYGVLPTITYDNTNLYVSVLKVEASA